MYIICKPKDLNSLGQKYKIIAQDPTTYDCAVEVKTLPEGHIELLILPYGFVQRCLPPSYGKTLTPKAPNTYNSDPFRYKNILIVGDTNSPQTVVVDYNADGAGSVRDHPVFTGDTSTTVTTIYKQLGFLTFKRSNTGLTLSYQNSLNRGHVQESKGVAVNVLFDLLGSYVSWNYDNSNITTHDYRYIRCTFANYNTWLSNYSGVSNVVHVGDSVFSKTTTTQYDNLGGNQFDVAVDLQNGTYDINTYPQSGHLYFPSNVTTLIE